MSTNARIGIERPESNSVESIYTHWDGYPEHHGILLLDCWNTREAVESLIALGNLSVLGKEVGQKHDFDAPYDDPVSGSWCLAYGRDRGEVDVSSITHPHDEWPDYGQEYEYLYSPHYGWSWRECSYSHDPDGSNFQRRWGKWAPLLPSDCMSEESTAEPVVVAD